MYIKIFESRQTDKSYMIRYPVTCLHTKSLYLENEKHNRVDINERELFDVIDKLFKDKNATNQEC